MNNPNPFVPKGSLLEQQNKRRTHMKLGVLCVLVVSVTGLMAMLIQGCKQKTDDQTPPPDTNSIPVDTNTPAADTNPPPVNPASNTVMVPSPMTATQAPSPIVSAPTPPPIQPAAAPAPTTSDAAGGDYVVVKGDTLGKIARKNGVSLKALLAANPDVKPTRLKVNQKLVIPPGGKSPADTGAPGATAGADAEGITYTVKSGDTLTKIARTHHVKVKALQAANGLSTTKIKVGQKLKIPSKGDATAVAAAPLAAPAPDLSTPAPPVPAVSASPAAAPAH